MAIVTRRPDLETKEDPYVAEYTCPCGRPVRIHAEAKPGRLVRCFECAFPLGPGDLPGIPDAPEKQQQNSLKP